MSQLKERPILFSAPMVRAILDGRKTVTRRAITDQPPAGHRWCGWVIDSTHVEAIGKASWGEGDGHVLRNAVYARCSYGRVGDRLWVREAWAADAQVDSVRPRDLSHGEPIFYPADGKLRQTGCAMISQGRGRPSIHMPRWASRILLEITDVRVERLQDISEAQAKAEGPDVPVAEHLNAAWVVQFRRLWESINGPEAWTSNAWVWAVEFKRIEP